MQAIRHIFEHAPASIPIPEQWRQKRLEVILLVQEDVELQPIGVKTLLGNMPEVGEDEDFIRLRVPQQEETIWDS